MRVLIAEDEADLAEALTVFFEKKPVYCGCRERWLFGV